MITYDTTEENELAGRLAELASTTGFDDEALEKILARVEAPPGATTRRVLVAVAAGSLAVAGMAVALTSTGSGSDRVDATDSDLTTSTAGSETSVTSAPAGEGTTTSTVTSSTTTTVVADGDQPEGSLQPGAADPAPPDDGSPTATPPPTPRADPVLTLASSHYTVELLHRDGTLYLRRTDLVGAGPTMDGGPDGYGASHESSWGDSSGPDCLATSGRALSFPNVPIRNFTFGFAGPGIDRAEMVLAGGTRVAIPIGPAVEHNGFRVFLLERPEGPAERVEGFDADGNLVATITVIGGTDDYGYSQGTC